MANYHFEVQPISRGQGHSFTRSVSYICGERLRDSYTEKICYSHRDDVLFQRVFLPDKAPPSFCDLQHLCDEIEEAEKRYDARPARRFIASLPNELPIKELILIVCEFINTNFVEQDLCAIAAIHEGCNEKIPARNNPHVHIIVPTRTVGPDGFSKLKDREHDKRQYVHIWRAHWAEVQNRAYERNHLNIRVSHESLEVQGVRDREPVNHLNRMEWQREQRGNRTAAGDQRRAIVARNEERALQRQSKLEHSLALTPSR